MSRHAYERQVRQMSTPELKLREAELVQETSGWHFEFGSMDFNSQQDYKIAERTTVEHELLRRWMAGDKGAYLPVFGQPQ